MSLLCINYKKLDGIGIDVLWNTLQHSDQKDIIYRLINTLKIIHSVNLPNASIYYDDLQKDIESNASVAIHNPFIQLNEAYNVLKKIKKYIGVFSGKKNVINHNDFWYMNILFDQGQNSVHIIDFEMSLLAPIQIEFFRILHHKIFSQITLLMRLRIILNLIFWNCLFKVYTFIILI